MNHFNAVRVSFPTIEEPKLLPFSLKSFRYEQLVFRGGHLNDTGNIPSHRGQEIERTLLYPKTKRMCCSLVFPLYTFAPMTPNLKTPKQLTQLSRNTPYESFGLK